MFGTLAKRLHHRRWFVMRQQGRRIDRDIRHADSDTTAISHAGRRRPWLRFLLHLGEMVLAMMLGMLLLDAPSGAVISALGYSDSGPVPSTLVMTFNMTVPMVLWMRFRGHAWARAGEMGAAMVIPAIVIVVLGIVGVIPQSGLSGAVMDPMLPAMVAVMLYRRAEYAHSGTHRQIAPSVS